MDHFAGLIIPFVAFSVGENVFGFSSTFKRVNAASQLVHNIMNKNDKNGKHRKRCLLVPSLY